MISIASSKSARSLKTTPESRAALDGFMKIMAIKITDKERLSYTSLAIICADCGYAEWLRDHGRVKFGVENKMSKDVISGAVDRLTKEGKAGQFFEFFCAKNEAICEHLGIAASDADWKHCIDTLQTLIKANEQAKSQRGR